jgi:hypothetical protein
MYTKPPTKVEKALKLNYSHRENIWLTNQNTLRKLVGILGMILPPSLWLFLYLCTYNTEVLPSISHYYYTRANSIFIITVSSLAIFLIIYKGKAPHDFYLSSIAGVFALCLLMLPTSNLYNTCPEFCPPLRERSGISYFFENSTRVLLHYISAAIFLLSLALISLFVFTLSDKPKEKRTKQKILRNKIYIACGIIMILAVLVIFPGCKIISQQYYENHNLTFWMETVAVECFGISWMVKAEVVLKDF